MAANTTVTTSHGWASVEKFLKTGGVLKTDRVALCPTELASADEAIAELPPKLRDPVVDFDFPAPEGGTVEGHVTLNGEVPSRGGVTGIFPQGTRIYRELDATGGCTIPYAAGDTVRLDAFAAIGDQYSSHAQRVVSIEPGAAVVEDFALNHGTSLVAWVSGIREGETSFAQRYPGTLDHVPGAGDFPYLWPVAYGEPRSPWRHS